jgi:addiction module HigA family antidote
MTSKSLTTIDRGPEEDDLLPLIAPGEILLEEFLKPMGITQYRLAQDIHVPARRINEIVHGSRAITADTALRLGRYFGIGADFWMRLQSTYSLRAAERELGPRLEREVKVLSKTG